VACSERNSLAEIGLKDKEISRTHHAEKTRADAKTSRKAGWRSIRKWPACLRAELNLPFSGQSRSFSASSPLKDVKVCMKTKFWVQAIVLLISKIYERIHTLHVQNPQSSIKKANQNLSFSSIFTSSITEKF